MFRPQILALNGLSIKDFESQKEALATADELVAESMSLHEHEHQQAYLVYTSIKYMILFLGFLTAGPKHLAEPPAPEVLVCAQQGGEAQPEGGGGERGRGRHGRVEEQEEHAHGRCLDRSRWLCRDTDHSQDGELRPRRHAQRERKAQAINWPGKLQMCMWNLSDEHVSWQGDPGC